MSRAAASHSAIRATYRLQFHKGFTFRDAAALVPYLARLGDQPCLRLATDGGAPRLDPRLRHRRPRPAQPRDRHRSRVRGAGRRARGARHGPHRRHRAEPHGCRRRRQRLVARCARMGRGLALCRLLRHQLGPAARRPERPGAAAGARRPIRRRAGKRRDRAALRAGRRNVQRLVLRAPFSDLAAVLCGDPALRRSGAERTGRRVRDAAPARSAFDARPHRTAEAPACRGGDRSRDCRGA